MDNRFCIGVHSLAKHQKYNEHSRLPNTRFEVGQESVASVMILNLSVDKFNQTSSVLCLKKVDVKKQHNHQITFQSKTVLNCSDITCISLKLALKPNSEIAYGKASKQLYFKKLFF